MITTGFFVLTTTFLRPSIHSLTSQRATLGQGAAMGLSNSAVSLGRVIGPLWAGAVFDHNPDYPYVSGALILFSGFHPLRGMVEARTANCCATGCFFSAWIIAGITPDGSLNRQMREPPGKSNGGSTLKPPLSSINLLWHRCCLR